MYVHMIYIYIYLFAFVHGLHIYHICSVQLAPLKHIGRRIR